MIPLPAGTASLRLENASAKVLASRLAASQQTVTITAPRAHAVIPSRPLVVTWRTIGASSMPTIATVDLSINGGHTWRTIAAAVPTTSVVIPAFALSRSAHAQIRVRVSDGFSWKSAIVAGLRMAGTAPTISIQGPILSGGSLTAGTTTRLTATARDDANRALQGRSIRWLAGGKRIATGTRLALTPLKPGRHTITAVATDSTGRTARATYTLTILPLRRHP